MKRSDGSPLGVYMIGVAALFLAGFLLLVIFGAQAYRETVAVQSANNTNRALLNYFVTCVSTSDSGGNLSIEESEYGPVVVIPDGSTGYGLRIYCVDGLLLDDYAALDAALMPDVESPIARTQVFLPELLSDDLLRVTTDAGSILVHVRSEGNTSDPATSAQAAASTGRIPEHTRITGDAFAKAAQAAASTGRVQEHTRITGDAFAQAAQAAAASTGRVQEHIRSEGSREAA